MENKELLLRKILDISPSIIYICNISGHDHKTVYLNKKAKEMVGCSGDDESEQGASSFSNALHPDDRKILFARHEELGIKGEGSVSETEYRLHVEGDGWRWIKSREAIFSRDELGAPKEILGIAEDITDTKLASSLLHKSEEMFRRVFDESPIGAAILNTDFQFLKVNEFFCKMLKYEEHELLYKKFPEVTHPDDLAHDLENVKKLLAGEIEVYKTDKRYITKDNTIVTGRVTLRLVRDAVGNPAYFLPLIEDITSITKIEKEVSVLNLFIDKLLKTSNAIIVQLDNEGTLVRFNPAASDITGYKEEELVGKNWFNTIVPENRYPEIRKEFNRLLVGGLPQDLENPILTKTGDEKYVRWRNSQILDDGKIVGTLSFGVEVTGYKKIERELAMQLETSDRLNRLLMDREVRMAELKAEIQKLKLAPLSSDKQK